MKSNKHTQKKKKKKKKKKKNQYSYITKILIVFLCNHKPEETDFYYSNILKIP